MKKFLFSFIAGSLLAFSSTGQSTVAVGSAAPTFSVTDVHGVTHDLAAITGSGKWVVIDFFFTTCGPCQIAAPHITELYNKYGCNQGDLFVISIDTGDSDAEVLAYEATYSGTNPGPSVSGDDGGGNDVVSAYGVGAFPTVVLIGSDGLMKVNDIWPIGSVADIEAAFTAEGFSPTPQSCSSAGIEENTLTHEVTIFPNPAVNSATVSVDMEASNEVTVNVYNLLGAVVATQSFNGTEGENNFEINTRDLENGRYIVNVSINGVTSQVSLNILK